MSDDSATWLREFAAIKLGDDAVWGLTDQATLRACADELAELRKEVERLTNVYDITHRALFAATERNIALEQQLARGEQGRDAMSDELADWAADTIAELQKEVEVLQSIREDLARQRVHAEKDAAELRKENERLKADLLDTTWQDHADAWQRRAVKAETKLAAIEALGELSDIIAAAKASKDGTL